MITFIQLLKKADSNDWDEREHAGYALGQLLETNFDTLEQQLIDLRQAPSENIRRFIIIGLKYFARKKETTITKRVLAILELYLDDDSNYVKKNLGPFAIGDALIRYDTENTLNLIKRNAYKADLHIKWNICMIFTAASGAQHFETGIPILEKHIFDTDKKVRNAALFGLRNIYKRIPPTKNQVRHIIENALKQHSFNKRSLGFLIDS